MNTEKRRRFLISFSYFALIALLIWIVFKYLLGLLFPFVIGFFIAALLNPVSRYLSKRLSLARKFVSFVLVLLFYAVAGTLFISVCIKLFVWLGKLFASLPDFYAQTLSPVLSGIFERISDIVSRFDNSVLSEYGALFSDVQISLGSAISALSAKAVGFISGIAAHLPMLMLEILLTVISTFFFAADYDYLTRFLLSLLPTGMCERMRNVKSCLFAVLTKYLRSYFLIFIVTFAELFLGLTLAGVSSPAGSALIISLLDILPVLGIGIVLIPWGLIRIALGEMRLGVMLFLLYGVMTVVRNVIEPKIVGKEVGLHPTLTLISMFVGVRLFGVLGLFGLPITLSVAKEIYDCNKA